MSLLPSFNLSFSSPFSSQKTQYFPANFPKQSLFLNLPKSYRPRQTRITCCADSFPPPSINWKSVATPVRDQKDCKCSAVIAVVGAVEGLMCIKTGELKQLSVQEVIDCNRRGSKCSGSSVLSVFNHIVDYGISEETAYKFRAKTGKCKKLKGRKHLIKGYGKVSGGELELRKALEKQPIVAYVCAAGLKQYKNGVFKSVYGNQYEANHAVLIVGCGITEDGVPYWEIKSSFGDKFGEDGYARLFRSDDEIGPLGLYTKEAYYPIM